MNADLVRMTGAIVVAAGSWAVLRFAAGRPEETRFLDRMTAGVFCARLSLTLVVYLAVPDLVRHSDAIAFYLPETLSLLAGELPYRDFVTNYGPCFHVVLAPLVALWRSAGAIVLTMVAAEGLLLLVYRRYGARCRHDRRFARGVWLMVSSPIMVYWVGIVGYNSVLIALFTLLGLILATGPRHVAAGLAGAAGWIACKALGVLTWPTIVLIRREGAGRRLAAFVAVGLVFGVLLMAGFDVLMPFRREHDSWTGGNVGFLLAIVVPALYQAPLMSAAAAIALVCAWGAATVRWLRPPRAGGFDEAMAHVTFVLAAFLLTSHKSPVMYTPMLLPFAVHVALRRGPGLRPLLPLLVLGALGTSRVESGWLGDMIASRHFISTAEGLALLGRELVKMGALAAIAGQAWSSLRQENSAVAARDEH